MRHARISAGTVALSGPLIEALDALFNARIPSEWLAGSWEASTLGNWFLGLLQRHEQLSKWLNSGRLAGPRRTGSPASSTPRPAPSMLDLVYFTSSGEQVYTQQLLYLINQVPCVQTC